VFSVCYRILNNREEAEDIAQEVFVKAFFSLKKHKSNESKFSSWLYRIAFTSSISKKREFKFNKVNIEELSNYKNVSFVLNKAFLEIEKEERKLLVREAINKLKNDERFIIHLYYFLECSIEEISYITKLNKDYIKIRLYRIRAKLKSILETLQVNENKKYGRLK
jgi:RNA polymerase sigma-70 factor (ECF subfamily)